MFNFICQRCLEKEADRKRKVTNIWLQTQQKYIWFMFTTSNKAVALQRQAAISFFVEQVYII